MKPTKLNALDLLQAAMAKIKEAENMIAQAKEENESLKEYYGYSLEIIEQELNLYSDNSRCYQGRFTNIEDIIEDCGQTWFLK